MPFSLKILTSPDASLAGRTIPLAEGPNVVGRVAPPCTIRLDGAKVSKRHCTFTVAGARLSVEDHNSANGIYLNGKKVAGGELKAKDKLVVGDFTLEVVAHGGS